MSFWGRLLYGGLFFLATYFALRYFLWWINPEHTPHNFIALSPLFSNVLNSTIFLILTFVVFLGTLLRFATWFAVWFASRPRYIYPRPGLKAALVTCFVPSKEPLEMLETTLEAMVKVSYPHDSWVLDEGNDPQVKAIAEKLGVKHFSRMGIEKYNQDKGIFRAKTKAGNHNAWRDNFERNYDVVGQIDVDNVPKPEYFERTLGYFSDPKVGLVVMPQVYHNLDNWIARGAAEQAYFFHGPMQQGFYGSDMPFLIGTSHIYRTRAMNQIGGYAPTIVEDHLTGMHFYANGWKGVFVPEVLAEGEGPMNWVDYLNQQMRWSYGLFEILFKHTPKIIWKLKIRQKINYFLAQLYYFTGVGVFLGMILTTLYLIFGVRAASMNLVEWLRYAVPSFFFVTVLQIYTHRFHLKPKEEPYFGFLGMFLNLAANLVYTIALLNFITGKKLKYMVTQKGSTAQRQQVPLITFLLHILLGLLSLTALVVSYLKGNGAVQLRFWALFSTLSLFAIALSIYWDHFYGKLKTYRYAYLTFRLGLNLSLAGLVVLFLSFSFVQKNLIAQAFFTPQSEIDSVENLFVPLAGKVSAPQDGAMLGVSLFDLEDRNALWDVEKAVDRKFSLVGYYQSWGAENNRFSFDDAKFISETGATPFITWEPWEPVYGFSRSASEINQEEYRLKEIISGKYDSYITSYARDVKAYRKPVVIRFAHEMNGNWYPWGSTLNTPTDYVLAWRHVHSIFKEEGATNVTWVWAPNEVYLEDRVPLSSKIEMFYPGAEYVDWVGVSSFNWGGSYKQNRWRSPSEMFGPSVDSLKQFGKPLIIAETASVELETDAGKKALWIGDLSAYVQANPEIKGVVWFNTEDLGVDWSITTSSESESAFTQAFSAPYFK